MNDPSPHSRCGHAVPDRRDPSFRAGIAFPAPLFGHPSSLVQAVPQIVVIVDNQDFRIFTHSLP
jgi:hypothetical protein